MLTHKRNFKDTTQDTILLLFLLKETQGKIKEKNDFDAKKRLMKMVFLAEKKMAEKKQKGFNFFFNVYEHGPCSWELLNILDDLTDAGLIEIKEGKVKLNSFGERVVDEFIASQSSKQKKRNKDFFSLIKKITNETKDLSLDELLNKVYKIKMVPLGGKKEIDIGKATEKFKISLDRPKPRLLMKLPEKFFISEFEIDEGWVRTFMVICNPDFRKFVRDAAK